MQFDEAGEIVVPVRWYFTDPAAETMPRGTLFYSRNWDTWDSGYTGPGEVWTSERIYNKGARSTALTGTGNFCGPLDWFEDGTPSDAPPVVLSHGLATCCIPVLYRGQLGVFIGLSTSPPCFKLTPPFNPFLFEFGNWVRPDAGGGSSFDWFVEFPPPYGPGGVVNLGTGPPGHPICVAASFATTFQGLFWGGVGQGPYFNSVDRSVFSFNFTSPGAPAGTVYFRNNHLLYEGSLGLKVGLSSVGPIPVYFGKLGLKIGLDAGEKASYPGVLGVLVGLDAVSYPAASGALGVLVGLESTLEAQYPAEIGVKVGIESTSQAQYPGQLGLKLGLVSSEHASYAGTLGVKVGLVSSLRASYAGTLGVKVGLVSSSFGGISTSCCPGAATPLTLHGTGSGGTAFTTTYSSGLGGWQFTDPDSGFVFTLKCVSVGASFQWQATNAQAGCGRTYSVQSLTCYPFALHCRTVLSGGSCIPAGTYNFTFSS